jgi:hypothetical protein
VLHVVVSPTIEAVWKLLHKQVQNFGYNRQHPNLQNITYRLSFTGENKTDSIHIKLNIVAPSPNHSCQGKIVSIAYSECVFVALVIKHAKHMRHIILSSVAYLAVQYFPTLSHRRQDVRGWGRGGTEHEMWFVFSTTSI